MSCVYKNRIRQSGASASMRRWFTENNVTFYVDYWTCYSGRQQTIHDLTLDYKASKTNKPACPPYALRPKIFKPLSNVIDIADNTAMSYGQGTWYVNNKTYVENFPIGLYHSRVLSKLPSGTVDIVIADYTTGQIQKAFSELIPSFHDAHVKGINLITFIAELTSVRRLFTKATLSLKGSFSDVPDKHLMVNFGVLPFFGDMVALWEVATKLNVYIDKWNHAAQNGYVWDKHRLIGSSESSKVLTLTNIMLSSSTIATNVLGGVKKSSSARCHIYFKPRHITDHSRKLIFYSALGLDKPLPGLWEAVPFSWAIDYFYNIGKIIDNFDESLENMFKIDFVDAGYTIKGTVTGGYTATSHAATYQCRSPYTTFSQIFDRTVFNRVRLPMSTVVEFSQKQEEVKFGWDKGMKQASYLAAVAYLKVHK